MRSFSGSTRVSAGGTSQEIRDRDFMFWLNDIPESSPALKILTDDEIKIAFTSEGCKLLAKPQNHDEQISELIEVSKYDYLTRCQLAQLSEDGQFLKVPNSHWTIKGDRQESIYIRQAYHDHWDIIYDHFVVQRSSQRVLISGTPGCGKSIEGYFFLFKIFEIFPDNPPPIFYAPSETTRSAVVFFRGFVFTTGDYHLFEQSLSYKIMDANGPIWHIYDSTVPGNHDGCQEAGPQIIISSPGRSERPDMKPVWKGRRLLLYLPLPNLAEMHLMRSNYFNDPRKTGRYISTDHMISLIAKWGCVPRTVFEVGNDQEQLNHNETKIHSAGDVERLIHLVGSSQVDHDVASGSFLHIVPIPAFRELEGTDGDGGETNAGKKIGKRKSDTAGMDQFGLSESQRIRILKSHYIKIVYTWASDYIRDKAFDAFLTLGSDRMMPLIVNYQQAELGGFRGLLFEPFVYKLLAETGVIGRMKNLDTGTKIGSVRLGPWTKNVYQNHSQLVDTVGMINIPLKGNEAAVDALVPCDGYLFQITVSGHKHGVNRPGLQTLMDSGIFANFVKRHARKNKNISLVFIVEAGRYDGFQRQDYHGPNKQLYAANSPLRHSYPGITQFAFEVDLRRIYKFNEHQKKNEIINMTDQKAAGRLEKVVQKGRMT
jgi:hypothetical protein